MAIERSYLDGNARFIVLLEDLLQRVTNHQMVELAREAVEKEMSTDPELRILVREMVKQSISQLNLQQIVDEAVKNSLKAEEVEAQKEK